jgi:hypothetical protein
MVFINLKLEEKKMDNLLAHCVNFYEDLPEIYP